MLAIKINVIFYYKTTKLNEAWKFTRESDGHEDQFQVQLPLLSNYVDAESNAIVTYNNKSVWDPTRCGEYINTTSGMLKNGHKFFIQVDAVWPGDSGVKESFKIYLYPTDRNLTDDEKNLILGQR